MSEFTWGTLAYLVVGIIILVLAAVFIYMYFGADSGSIPGIFKNLWSKKP